MANRTRFEEDVKKNFLAVRDLHLSVKRKGNLRSHCDLANPLDKTLEALQNIQDAIDIIKTRKTVISEKRVLQDYDKIISYLEDATDNLINAVVISQKHERPL
jgi:hypothetical protein